MAGLSMGSMQTSMTVCRYSQLFGWEGLFSGFMHNFIGEDPDNSYLEIMKEKEFQEKQHLFFRAMGRQDEFWDFLRRTMLSVKKTGFPVCAGSTEAGMTGMSGDSVSMIFSHSFSGKMLKNRKAGKTQDKVWTKILSGNVKKPYRQ